MYADMLFVQYALIKFRSPNQSTIGKDIKSIIVPDLLSGGITL